MKHLIHFACLAFIALLSAGNASAQSVVRGPYLQLQTTDAITVRWRTNEATNSMVRYGLSPGNLDRSVFVDGLTTEHSVRLSGLATGEEYYYSVGDSIEPLAGDSSFHFSTAPTRGDAADTRIWILGDSGTANGNAAAVRDAYSSWAGSDPADFWIMLGDNAYDDGTDLEYQAAVFDMYPEMLRQLPLWSTLGNHDGHTANSNTQTGPYYEIFDLPTAAEAGGLASGTEAYYSFDYANIHFVCLDSYESDRSVGGTMLQWLEADLATNTQPWVIAFWHHPPYTKGSHNSDSEGALIDMRQNALPILESWGVDLVLTGHSHTYERSYLIDGHYGSSGSFSAANHGVDMGDGRESSGDGVYEKPGIVAFENGGAVYAVAGSSGKVSTGYSLNHPAMFIALESLGSMVLDVSGNRLDGRFLDSGGTVQDSFTIMKTPDTDPPLLSAAGAVDATHVVVNYNEPVDAGTSVDPANYSIAGLDVSAVELLSGNRSVRLSTSAMSDGTRYTLGVSNVRDLVGNTIAAGSTIDFDYFETMELSFQDGIAPDPGYAGTRDAYIHEDSPTINFGSSTTLLVDGDDPGGTGSDINSLLAWDVSAIPAGATVLAAEIVLTVTDISSSSYGCYGLERSWTESEVSWNLSATGTPWGAPGAEAAVDRDAAVLCSVSAAATGQLTVPLSNDGIARVQSWVSNPADNHGLIIGNTSPTNGADFHSSESNTATARPRLNVIYRAGAPLPNNPPTAGFGSSCAGLDCSFTDGSTDNDGNIVSWSWDFGDGSSASARNPVHSYATAGNYTVTLIVTDDDGAAGQDVQSVSVSDPPQSADQFAQADVATQGSRSGTFLDTHADDEVTQALTERESGGKKDQRHSYLEHSWQFSVVPGDSVMLYANVWSGGSADGDAFRFEWSGDNSNWAQLFTVNSTSPENEQGAPITGSGTIYVRVIDTDRQPGNNALDTVYVDRIYIRSENGTPPPNQSPSADFSSSCSALDCSFTNTSGDTDGSIVSWAWTFGDGDVSDAQHPFHSYAGTGTYAVQLTVTDNDGDTGTISKNVNVSAGNSIILSANGYKVRGEHTVELNWTGTSGTVRILRDGSLLDMTDNLDTYTDNTGNKGGRTYIYSVCEALPSTNCSNAVTVVF